MPLRIVLVRARNPLNIGAAARAMANFGLHDLALVEPYVVAWDEVRSARAGAAVLRKSRALTSVAEAVADCTLVVGTTAGTARDPTLPLEEWEVVAPELTAAARSAPVALLFGSEKSGLSRGDIGYCHRLARIPTTPGAPSLNLGQAVAICAYELARMQPPLALPPPGELAAGQLDFLTETWLPLLERLGVTQSEHHANESARLRQMLARWRLSERDYHRMLGLARQIRNHLPLDSISSG